MKAFIVDDEEDAIASLTFLLKEYFPEKVTVAGTARTIEEAEDKLATLKFDLLFLDVQLGEGNGFQLLQRQSNRMFEVIFVTAYEEYALEAIRVNALAYLLKPVHIDEFRDQVDKAIAKLVEEQVTDVKPLLAHFESLMQDKIGLPVSHGVEYIDKKNIQWVEADGSYSKVMLKEGRHLMISKNLKRFEELLSRDGFLRIHHSILVNVAEISKYDRLQGDKVIVNGGHDLPVSRKYRPIINEVLMMWNHL